MRSQAKAASARSMLHILAGALVIVLVAVLSPARSLAAEAIPTYNPLGSFGSGGSGDGQFNGPSNVAVEPGTGDILVTDRFNDRVQVFAPDGAGLGTFLTTIETGAGSNPVGIAIDQSSGDVYVSEAGAGAIVKYASDGAPVPTYSVDGTFTSPVAGSGPGEIGSFGSALAVDPTTHDLLVADIGNQRVSRYTADGGFVRSFDGSDSVGGAFTGLLGVAVAASGTTYVVDGTGDPAEGLPSRVETFDSLGVSQGALGGLDRPSAVAVDPGSGRVLVAFRRGSGEILGEFLPGGVTPLSTVTYPSAASDSSARGIAIDGSAPGRLYAVTDTIFGIYGVVSVQVFEPVVRPGVEITSPTNVTATSAHVSGTIDPGGVTTHVRFDYSSDGGSTWIESPTQDVGVSGAVEADLTDLAPNTSYLLRIVASNDTETTIGSTTSFNTLVSAPAAVTRDVTDIKQQGAVVYGSVTAFGLQTTYYFEYGETTAYGQTAPNPGGIAGEGRQPRAVSAVLTGLRPGITYHYRLVSSNSVGSTTGADQSFTTLSATTPTRGYELVSPPEKGAGIVWPEGLTFAGQDGDGVVFATRAAIKSVPTPSLLQRTTYLATRSAGGWSTKSLDVPTGSAPREPERIPVVFWTVLSTSSDLSHSLVLSTRNLAPGGIDGQYNLYMHASESGENEFIATAPGTALALGSSPDVVIGATPDFSRVTFQGPPGLLPDAVNPSVYEWSAADGLRLVSREADGSPAMWPVDRSLGPHETSEDGRRIFWSQTYFGFVGGLYLREDGTRTIAISASHRESDAGAVQPAQFAGATADGSSVVFQTQGTFTEGLTEDATGDASFSIYRYDVDDDQMTLLAKGLGQGGVVDVSPDLERVYFLSRSGALPNNPLGQLNLYVWDHGTIHYVSQFRAGTGAAFSPSGRYVALKSFEPLTDFDARGPKCLGETGYCGEIYRYDADTQDLICVSCRSDGARPSGDANLGGYQAVTGGLGGYKLVTGGEHVTRAVHDSGEVFFDSPDPLVSADANGTQDVYAFADNRVSLLSRGRPGYVSRFMDADADGSDVFFSTDDPIVRLDTDTSVDIYDARVGGGIAAQNLDPPRGACGDCRGEVASPPTALANGSESLAGNSSRLAHRRCGKGRRQLRVKGKPRCIKSHRAHRNRGESR